MNFTDLPRVKWSENLVEKSKCLIDGEEHPLFIGRIIKMMSEGEQPRILILADPGHGKTWASGRLGEILHNELEVLPGKFNPDNQIKGDPLEWSRSIRKERQKIFMMPDADSVFPSDEYHTPKNRNNRNLIYLSRRFSNMLLYDAHEMAKCAKSIRTNHNIRLVSVGGADQYKFKVDKVSSEVDSMQQEIIEKDLGFWKSNKPSKKTRQRIEELDEKEKERKVIEGEEEMIMRRKKEELKKQAMK